jgi:hypothetical protein
LRSSSRQTRWPPGVVPVTERVTESSEVAVDTTSTLSPATRDAGASSRTDWGILTTGKVRVTGGAGAYVASPGWLAVTRQVPAPCAWASGALTIIVQTRRGVAV